MDKAGRIVIPKEIRDRIGLEATRFDLDLVMDRIELTPREKEGPKPHMVEKAGAWAVVGKGNSNQSIVEAIQKDRAEREEHLLGFNTKL